MKAFLKDNIAIVAAIILPAVLALFFALSTLVSTVTVADPQYDFLISSDYYNNTNSMFNLNVVNDRLVVSYRPPEKNENNYYNYTNKPRLWRVHAPEMTVQEISLPEPAEKKPTDISIAGITDVKVQNLQPGPDGYSYLNSYNYDRNLMSEIFSTGTQRDGYRVGLTKNGRVVPFRVGDNNTHYNTQFIGWIIEE